MGGSDPAQLVSPLEAKLIQVEAGKLVTEASSISRSDADGVGGTDASPTSTCLPSSLAPSRQ